MSSRTFSRAIVRGAPSCCRLMRCMRLFGASLQPLSRGLSEARSLLKVLCATIHGFSILQFNGASSSGVLAERWPAAGSADLFSRLQRSYRRARSIAVAARNPAGGISKQARRQERSETSRAARDAANRQSSGAAGRRASSAPGKNPRAGATDDGSDGYGVVVRTTISQQAHSERRSLRPG